MAVDLSSYGFLFSIEEFPDLDRHAARDEVGRAFPELNAEVIRRAGNRYAFLNR
jgi:hypothetical protein